MPTSSKSSHRILANTFWLGLDQALTLLGGVITSVLVARALGPVKLGYYSYIFWIVSTTVLVGHLGVARATRKYIAEFMARRELSLAKWVYLLTLRFQIVATLAIVAAGLLIVGIAVPPEHRTYAWLAVLCIGPSMVMMVFTASNAAVEDLAANVWPSLVASLVNFFGVLLTLWQHWELVGLASSLLASRVTDLVLRYLLFRRRFSPVWDEVDIRTIPPEQISELRVRIRRFCVQASVVQILTIVLWDRSEIFFLKQFSSVQQIAFYSLAFNISQQILLFPRTFSSAVGASMLVRAGVSSSDAARMAVTALRFMAVLALPLTFAVAALSDPLMRIMYGSQYEPAAPVLGILALFCSVKILSLPVQNLLTAIDRQDVLVKIMIAFGAVNIALDLLLIPGWGAMGAAVANAVAQTAAGVAMWVLGKRVAPMALAEARLPSLVLVSGAAAAPAFLAARFLPPLFALAIGILCTAGLYLALLRITRVMPMADRTRLLTLEPKLPAAFRLWYRRGLEFVVPQQV